MSDSTGHGQQNSSCVLANQVEGSTGFPRHCGLWRMHIPEHSQIVSPLYPVTWKKNDLKWDLEQQETFEQVKQEIAHAGVLRPVRMGQDVRSVLYRAAWENGPSGVCGRRDLERLKHVLLGSGVWDTEDLRPATPQVRKRFGQFMKGFKLPQK